MWCVKGANFGLTSNVGLDLPPHVLPADGRAAFDHTHLHEMPHTGGVQRHERIPWQQLLGKVVPRERVHVVAAQAKRHLRQIVGAETEEVRVRKDRIGTQRRTRDLAHRADHDLELTRKFLSRLCLTDRLFGQPTQVRQLGGGADQGDHDLRSGVYQLFLAGNRRLH